MSDAPEYIQEVETRAGLRAIRSLEITTKIVVILVTLAAAGLVSHELYTFYLNSQQNELVSRNREIAAVIQASVNTLRLDESRSDEEAEVLTLEMVSDALDDMEVFYETGEFTIGRLEENDVIFLHVGKELGKGAPTRFPMGHERARMMQNALLGETGWMIAPDYRGQDVLSAYRPITELGWGLVTKRDMADIRTPFIQVALRGGGLVLLCSVFGALLLSLLSRPVIRQYAKSQRELATHRLHLEELVEERTSEFQKVTQQLLQEAGNREQAVEARQKSEERLEFVLKSCGIGVWVWDLDTDQVSIDATMKQLFFDNAAEGRITNFDEFAATLHPDEVDRVGEAVKATLQTHEPYDIDYRIKLPNNSERIIHAFGRLILARDRSPVKLFGTCQDVTEREQLVKEKTRLSAAIENIDEAVIVTDLEGVIQFCNPAFEEVTGYTRAYALNKNPRILNSGEQPQSFFVDMFDRLKQGHTFRGQLVNRRKDGAKYVADMVISPMRGPDGEAEGYVSIHRDITQSIEQERRLIQHQKLEALGTLAGGIAHDFNNVLTAILGYTELIEEELPEDSPLRQDVSRIVSAAERASDLVRQILSASSSEPDVSRNTRIHSVLIEVMELLRPSIPTSIEVICDVDETCGPVRIDPTYVHQIVMNMATNAYHAMKESGGRLEVTLRQAERLPAELEDAASVGVVELIVRDTGMGMTQEQQNRIFDPFFTTKPQGEGTGLGLATVHSIVTNHKGVIEVDSVPGSGSAFHVFLPVSDVPDEIQEQTQDLVVGDGQRILVVDDDPAVANMICRRLRRLNYDVTYIKSSELAFDRLIKEPEEFELLLTDQTMPDLTGDKLFTQLRAKGVHIPVIVMTGFSDTLSEQLAFELGFAAFLHKPMQMKDLAHTLTRVFDGNPGCKDDSLNDRTRANMQC